LGILISTDLDPQTINHNLHEAKGNRSKSIRKIAFLACNVISDRKKRLSDRMMGLKASSTAAIRFSNVRVPKENLLAKPSDGFKIAMTILNYGRLALGFHGKSQTSKQTEFSLIAVTGGKTVGKFD
jgi:hypothetical protein